MAMRAITRAPSTAPGIERAPVGIAIAVWVIALIGFFPVLYLVATSLKTEAAAEKSPCSALYEPSLYSIPEMSSGIRKFTSV